MTIAVVFTFVLAAPVRALQRRRRARVHRRGAGHRAPCSAPPSLLLMLVAAPAAAWWSRAPLIVHELVEAMQRWRDALFPYATPAPLIRPSPAAPRRGRSRSASAWRAKAGSFTRLAIGETISFALSASATVILLYFLLASERWLVHAHGRRGAPRRARAR